MRGDPWETSKRTMRSESSSTLSVSRPLALATRSVRGAARANEPRDGIRSQVARRLARELESLEASLLAAERAAIACRPTHTERVSEVNSDVASRRAELDRRELELQERERALERQRTISEQAHERLVHAKDSLKRAIFKFRSQVAERTEELDARERRLASAHSELMEGRREFVREQIRLKAAIRESFQDSANTLPLTNTPFTCASAG